MTQILNFNDALNDAKSKSDKVHLLLGNGFSIAWNSSIFKYESLYNQANFNDLSPGIKKLFTQLNTVDFEKVMNHLKDTANTLEVYSPSNTNLIAKLREDYKSLKELLVKTIAKNHPEKPDSISEEEFENCGAFLSNFRTVYSLNYDLLLYWTYMSNLEGKKLPSDDGFRTPSTGQGRYVTWEINNTNTQNVHYLHGALHLFDSGPELQKYTWINTGIRLIDQIKDALDNNKFPLFVSEGSSPNKMERINHSSYLSRAYRSLGNIGGSLFIYGHSLASNDEHIYKAIKKSKIQNLYVSIYGDPESAINSEIILNATKIVNEINLTSKKTVGIKFYSAESTKIWRS